MGAGGASLIVLSMLLLRRKKPYGAISHGVVEVRARSLLWGWLGLCSAARPQHHHPPVLLQVDPMLSLEEQQLRELQRHGYENPTYRFLEDRP